MTAAKIKAEVAHKAAALLDFAGVLATGPDEGVPDEGVPEVGVPEVGVPEVGAALGASAIGVY